jgi:hypothetical protein
MAQPVVTGKAVSLVFAVLTVDNSFTGVAGPLAFTVSTVGSLLTVVAVVAS